MTMLPDDAGFKGGRVRRIEVFTGAGSRRRWSREEKARIVAESYAGVESICAVARRYGLAQTQIFTWRRELRAPAPPEQMFVPVVVEPAPKGASTALKPKSARRRHGRGGIELDIDGVTVRVAQGADRRTLETVLRALKAER
jgi:transposase